MQCTFLIVCFHKLINFFLEFKYADNAHAFPSTLHFNVSSNTTAEKTRIQKPIHLIDDPNYYWPHNWLSLSARRHYTEPHPSAIPFVQFAYLFCYRFLSFGLLIWKCFFCCCCCCVFSFDAKLLFHYLKMISISFLKLINLQLICNVRSIWNTNLYILPLFQFHTQTKRERGTNQSQLMKCFKTIRWFFFFNLRNIFLNTRHLLHNFIKCFFINILY